MLSANVGQHTDYTSIHGGKRLGHIKCSFRQIDVDWGNAKPIVKKPNGYLSYAEREVLRAELKDMLAHEALL